MIDYDSFITSPRYAEETVTVYCHNKQCKFYGDEQTVLAFREYGSWYWRPDECPHCWHDWHEEPVSDEQEGGNDG